MIDSPLKPVPAVRPAPASAAYHVREVVRQTITPNDFPRLISLVRTLAPDTGSARELGDGLQWEHDSGYSSLSLTINPEPEGTVIRADLRTDGQQVAYTLGAVGAGLLAAFVSSALHLPLGEILGIGATTLVASGWLARSVYRRAQVRQAEQLQQLVNRIAAGLRGDLE